MKTIGAYELKTKTGDVLDKVERGETVQITRRGKPVGRLVPEPQKDREAVRKAVAGIRRLRKQMPAIPLQDLLDYRHEGHRY